MYQVSDVVIYGMQGVCRIEAIEEKDFSGQERLYYVLKPVYQKALTVYVSVDNENSLPRMRKVLNKEEIIQLIHKMSTKKIEWMTNDALRKEKFSKVLHEGKREELIALIKAVYLHKQRLFEEGKKKLHIVDENAMKEAERMLYDEFAYVLNLEREEVIPFIIKQIGAK